MARNLGFGSPTRGGGARGRGRGNNQTPVVNPVPATIDNEDFSMSSALRFKDLAPAEKKSKNRC